MLEKAVLKSFNLTEYTATISIIGSSKVYLEDIAVARNIPSGSMVVGRSLVVFAYDEHNPKEAVVIAVYT